MPRLVITKGSGMGRDHAIGTECVVGRAPEVDFVVDDLGVSRRHARVYREGDTYVVADLGSRNGTFVNTQRIQAASLNDGDVIRVGGVELVFRQKDIAAKQKPPGAAVVVPPAVRAKPANPTPATPPVAPKAVPVVPQSAPQNSPAAPAADPAPAKKPMPNVVPTKRRRGAF